MIKNCLICNKEFTAKTNQRYCSKDCFKIAFNRRSKEWRDKNPDYIKDYQENYDMKQAYNRYYHKHKKKVLAKLKQKREEEKKSRPAKTKKPKNIEKLREYQHWYYVNVTKPKRQKKDG